MSDYDSIPGETLFRFPGAKTTIEIHGTGLGDKMIIRQFGAAFHEYLHKNPDPELGKVVIAFGAMEPAFNPVEGDINVYWWTSFGRQDDEPDTYLDHYLSEVSVKPDVIACLSDRQEREAEQVGYETMRLQFAQYGFKPLGIRREGTGYAGNIWHKRDEKVETVLDPFRDDDDFENVTDLGMPTQLNLWYNTKLATFGLFKSGQKSWGIVNNRVYEALASGTPLILEEHPEVEPILGVDYPYQTASRDESIELVRTVREDRSAVLERFKEYSTYIRENHTYVDRIESLFTELR